MRRAPSSWITLALLLLVASPALAVTRYVPSAAYATIQDAETASGQGDRIIIAAGYYEENVEIDVDDLYVSGECGDPRRVVVDGGDSTTDVFVVSATGVRIRCLTIQHGDKGIDANPATGMTLERLRILNSDDDGIELSNADDARIQLVEIIGAGSVGVDLDGDDVLITDTKVRQVGGSCFDLDINDSAVERNLAFQCEDSEGFLIDGDDNLIRNNTARFTEYPGLDLDGDRNQVKSNVFEHTGYSDDAVAINGDGNVIEYNEVSHTYYDALGIEGDDNTIRFNTVTNCFDDYCGDISGDDLVFVGNTCRNSENGFDLNGTDRALVEDNTVENAGFCPLLVKGAAIVVKNNVVRGSGDDLYDLDCDADCRDGEISGNLAENTTEDSSCFDIDITDPAGMLITQNDAYSCADEGLNINCDDCTVSFNEARYAGNDDEPGVLIRGDRNYVRNNVARDNAGAGIEVRGDDNHLYQNSARSNLRSGIYIPSATYADNLLERNLAQFNLGEGISNVGSDTDLVRNRSLDNRPGGDCTNDGTIDDDIDNVCFDGSDFGVSAVIDD